MRSQMPYAIRVIGWFSTMHIESFNPPLRTLMGPGPSAVHPRVLAAMARPTIGHLDPQFIRMMDEIKVLLQYVFRTENEMTLPIPGPGSAGMEACFVNLIEPGDKVVVCQNGVFGGRMKEVALRAGASVVVLEADLGAAIEPADLERTLAEHPDTEIVAFVHAETSTGVLSDAKALAAVAQRRGCLTIVDTVASLGGVPVKVDDWGLDVVYSGSQKCLSCAPGLSPLTFGERAVARLQRRKTSVQSWIFDLLLLCRYWGEGVRRTYHHTAPINTLYGLHEALLMLHEEGLEAACDRHALHCRALEAGVHAMGLKLTVPPEHRMTPLTVVGVPDGVDDAAVRSSLLERFDIEIGAGLGPLAGKVWRLGLMGQSSSMKNVTYCLSALETVLVEQGASIHTGLAVPAACAAART